MKLKFLGVRGSRPVHKKELLGFGGNTTSMEFVFETEKFQLFLDGGSGLAHYEYKENKNRPEKKYYFLISHTHWDHVLGLPFFKPFFDPKNHFTFYASTTSKATFSDLFLGLHSSVHLPIPPYLMQSNLNFVPVNPETQFQIESCVTVKTHQINHQGITLSYRLEYGKNSVAIVTDNAPIENGNYLGEGMKQKAMQNPDQFESSYNEGLVRFLKGTHTVVFDTHFTMKNIKPDWGHSAPQHALDFCKKAEVKRLILFHHAPEDSDFDVRNKVEEIREEGLKHGVEIVAAKEGDVWTLCE
jgi:phosphoribosyl 1,2-cyclic phosphodiesterase